MASDNDIISIDEINGHINNACHSFNNSKSSQSTPKIPRIEKRSFNLIEKKPIDNSKTVKFNPCRPQKINEDDDMTDFFNKVKTAKSSIKSIAKVDPYHKSVDSESNSNSEEDPDIALNNKIAALSNQNVLNRAPQDPIIDYSNPKANCAVENNGNKLNKFIASFHEK